MGQELASAFEVFCRLAGAELPGRPLLERATRRMTLAAGDALFLAGQPQPHVYVVNAGLIKMVYETPGGDSWVKGFAQPGTCFASLTALEVGGLTSYGAYAQTASAVDRIEYRALQQLADQHPPWQRAMANAYRIYGQRKERREMELLTLSAQDRYLSFLREHAELAGILKQRDIASYVRVTPVALSRIRARTKGQAPVK
jgi:CRP-like cAMP-binding protein